MKIWLITVGEPLPLPGSRERLLRTGVLAGHLASHGHSVLWWCSTVDHTKKRKWVASEDRIALKEGLQLQFLDGMLYRRNVSLARILNHRQVGERFRLMAEAEPVPDVVLCSLPTLELSSHATGYGRRHGVPVILDIRDLWPDIFADLVPKPLRWAAEFLLKPMYGQCRRALQEATAIFGVSEHYLAWGLDKAGRERTDNDRVYPLLYSETAWSDDDEKAVTAKLREAGIDGQAQMATFVGSFGRTYDLGTVIAAARTMQERAVSPARVQFVFCGTGDQEAQWREAARGLGNVAFLGWLNGPELAFMLRKSAVALAAYSANAPQGIPNKVIEYLAAGLPILYTLPGECRELLESSGCGSYYAAGDSQALCEALSHLLGSGKRHAMGMAARALYESRFGSGPVLSGMTGQLIRIARHESRNGATTG